MIKNEKTDDTSIIMEGYSNDWSATVCVGLKSESYHLLDEGAHYLKWDQEPTSELAGKIKSIYLAPSKSAMKAGKIPQWIQTIKGLEFLCMPIVFLPRMVDLANLPSLKSLMLIYSQDCDPFIEKIQLQWPKEKLLSLIELTIHSNFDAAEPKLINGLNTDVLPRLASLTLPLSFKDDWFEELSRFPDLKAVKVEHVRDFNIFKNLPSRIEALSILGAKKDFPIDHLKSFSHLKKLFLNGIQTKIDCSIFTDLPKLNELFILNSKKVENGEKLLECKCLKKLDVVNCNRPFTKELKEALQKMNCNVAIKHA